MNINLSFSSDPGCIVCLIFATDIFLRSCGHSFSFILNFFLNLFNFSRLFFLPTLFLLPFLFPYSFRKFLQSFFNIFLAHTPLQFFWMSFLCNVIRIVAFVKLFAYIAVFATWFPEVELCCWLVVGFSFIHLFLIIKVLLILNCIAFFIIESFRTLNEAGSKIFVVFVEDRES